MESRRSLSESWGDMVRTPSVIKSLTRSSDTSPQLPQAMGVDAKIVLLI